MTYFKVQKVAISYRVKFCFATVKAAESVSFRKYCMWILSFYKKLHMTKLSMRVELIP